MKPFLKWVGGKSQIMKKIMDNFPKHINNYYEPFLGGGSVLLSFLDKLNNKEITMDGKIYASDLNLNLIYLYKNIQTNPELLIYEVTKLINEYNNVVGNIINRNPESIDESTTSKESYYYWIRKKYNSINDKQSVLCSAMLLFLNKTCFRGVYREGPNGFNVPFGNYKNTSIMDEIHIRNVSKLIQNVNFVQCHFNNIIHYVTENDFIYLDPPYVPLNNTSFVSYNVGGFNDHKILFDLCKNMHKKKVKMLMSNSVVIKNEFTLPYFIYKIIECKRSINSKLPGSKTNEILVMNYYKNSNNSSINSSTELLSEEFLESINELIEELLNA